MPLPLYLLIVLSSFCLLVARLSIGVFGKENTGKRRGNNPETKAQRDADRDDNLGIGVDKNRGTKVDNPSTRTDVDIRVDKKTGVNDLGTRIDADVEANNLNIVADNASKIIDNLGPTAENSSTGRNTDAKINNPDIATNNKAHATSFFTLCRAYFCLPFLLN